MNKLPKFYSQYGEDHILYEFFERQEIGFFVDVGAFDGVHLSNSFCFEKLGWNGLCIEPQEEIFSYCERHRPKSVCVRAACVDNPDLTEITLSQDSTGLFSGMELEVNQPNIVGHYESLGLQIGTINDVSVPARTLNSILEDVAPALLKIDFVSVDVEGAEMQVLSGFDIRRYEPRVLVIEASSVEADSAICGYLATFGYIRARKIGPNLFFVTSEEDRNRICAIDNTCIMEKQMHPLGEKFTQLEYLAGKIIYKGRSGHRMLKEHEAMEVRIKEREAKVAQLLENMEQMKSLIESLRNKLSQ